MWRLPPTARCRLPTDVGGDGGNRTHTRLPLKVFETFASACSATSPFQTSTPLSDEHSNFCGEWRSTKAGSRQRLKALSPTLDCPRWPWYRRIFLEILQLNTERSVIRGKPPSS